MPALLGRVRIGGDDPPAQPFPELRSGAALRELGSGGGDVVDGGGRQEGDLFRDDLNLASVEGPCAPRRLDHREIRGPAGRVIPRGGRSPGARQENSDLVGHKLLTALPRPERLVAGSALGHISDAGPDSDLDHGFGLCCLKHQHRLLTLDHSRTQSVVAQIGGVGGGRKQGIDLLSDAGGRGVHDLHSATRV